MIILNTLPNNNIVLETDRWAEAFRLIQLKDIHILKQVDFTDGMF